MRIRLWIRSRLLGLIISPRTGRLKRWLAESRRRLLRRRHVVDVFLQLDDPYSYLLGQYLPELSQRYDIVVKLHLTQALGEAFRPHPEMLAIYAERDAARMAAELGLPFLDRGRAPPVEYRRALIDAIACSEGAADFDTILLEGMTLYWRGDSEGVQRRISSADRSDKSDGVLARNQRLLSRLGHYNTAMIHYAGEWYWGVDRLHYLAQRLDELNLQRPDAPNARLASIRQVMQESLPVAPPSTAKALPPLEFFFSFRSPYSYLAIGRVLNIADAFGVELKIRPVLPMVMRGMQVPRSKLLYIATDAAREASRLGVPIGKIADPVGPGAERLVAVFFYALEQKRERDFLANAGRATWVDGIDVATDKGMRRVSGRTGLFWPEVKAAMEGDSWREMAEHNREVLLESGSWGVPTLRLGDFVVWGQDRDWMLVRHIEELCDTGEGILI